jgi:hypothetical protein
MTRCHRAATADAPRATQNVAASRPKAGSAAKTTHLRRRSAQPQPGAEAPHDPSSSFGASTRPVRRRAPATRQENWSR